MYAEKIEQMKEEELKWTQKAIMVNLNEER
jgi:hypothetical protein